MWEGHESDTYQHPTPGAPGICPTHYHGVVDFLDDGDEIVTLQLWERGKKGKLREKAEKVEKKDIRNKSFRKQEKNM